MQHPSIIFGWASAFGFPPRRQQIFDSVPLLFCQLMSSHTLSVTFLCFFTAF
jgi:hypothetical protein